MKYRKSIQDFIIEYACADTTRLRLKNIEANFDVSWAILQIEARKKLQNKLPSWLSHLDVVFPSILSAEQCSSELTAQYKQRLVQPGSLLDLTGGLGVDSFYFAQKVSQVIYVERFDEYCRAAKVNFKALNAGNITVVQDDCVHFLQNNDRLFDTIYIDPARRGSGNKRVFALDECEPNVLEIIPLLTRYSKRLIIKVSPMADLSALQSLLPGIVEIHVVSVKNECKELLLVIDTEYDEAKGNNKPVTVLCAAIDSPKDSSIFSFKIDQEKQLPHSASCNLIKDFLYEPNSSILKAGAYKTVANAYDVVKLHKNSHLYTSERYVEDFPGRKFKVIETIPFNSKGIKQVEKEYPQLNLSTRNFPLTTAELKKRLKNKDGGDFYLFATTLSTDQKILIVCQKAH